MPGGLYPPPSVIESWPKPNYVDPVTQGPALVYACIVFSALSLAIVTARIYSRIFITKAPGVDDLLVVISAALGIALSVMLVLQEKLWLCGHHVWDIPIDKFAGQRKNIYLCEWFYVAASSSVKISILLFYRRLSVTFSKPFMIATYVGIVFNVLYFIAISLALLLIFRPIKSYWLSFDPIWAATHKFAHGDEAWSIPASAALSVVGDFYSTVLPLLLIRCLDLPQRQKTALFALFGIGFLVVAAGIVRTILLDRVIAHTYDITWVLWEGWIWTVVELNVAILAASAPALKPFVRRFLVDPVVSSGRRVTYAPHRGASAGTSGGGQAKVWTSDTTTGRSSTVPPDVEKIGIALTAPQSKADRIAEEIDDDASTKRYQLRTSQDGRLVPVQVHEERSYDVHSMDTATSTDFILPSNRIAGFNASAEHWQYRAQVEGGPRSSSRQHHQPNNPSDWKTKHPARTQSSGMRDRSGPLKRISSQSSKSSTRGSVTAARQHLAELAETGHAPDRSISRGSERNFALPSTSVVGQSPYELVERSNDDTDPADRGSSQETLGLPRQGSRNANRRSGVVYAQ